MTTGNKVVDEFLDDLDARLSPDDKRHPAQSKAHLRMLRDTVVARCKRDPASAEAIIRRFIEKEAVKLN